MSRTNTFWCVAALFIVAIGFGATGLAADGNCSRCNSCSDCDREKWGGAGCSFSSGCCAETGGNCNPQMETQQNLLLKPVELLTAETADGAIELARLSTGELMTWSCAQQAYVEYRLADGGMFEPVEPSAG